MIDPQSLDISGLPWLPLDARSAFPRQSAIYFAIDSKNKIQYIGISKDPKTRWGNHHRYRKDIATSPRINDGGFACLFGKPPHQCSNASLSKHQKQARR